MGLYLFRRESRGAVPDCWGEIESVYHQVESLFDHLQTIYRPMTIAMVRSQVEELVRQHLPKWRSWYETGGRELHVDPPEAEVPGEFDPAQLGVGLDALASWRSDVGPPGALTRVTWAVDEGLIEFRWREMPAPERAAASGRAGAVGGRAGRPVDALALPLLARIIAAHGGRLEIESGQGFGVRLRWPQSRMDTCGGDA
jgi:hypothetical protein